jgi:outer membrane protein assembly factor BamB
MSPARRAGVIELGELPPGSAAEPEPHRRPIRPADIRRYGLAAAVVLCLLALAGSIRPGPGGPPVLWQMTAPEGQFMLAGDAMYVMEPSGGTTITRYEAGTGRQRWTRTMPRITAWLSTDVPGVLLLPEVGQTNLLQTVTETLALNAADGSDLWRRPGEVTLTADRTLLTAEWDAQGERISHLRLVRTGDGTTVWDFRPDTPASGWTTLGTDPVHPDRLVTVSGQGHLEVRRFADGSLITRGTVPWVVPAGNHDDYAYVSGMDDLLFVVRTEDGVQQILAYRADTLERLWQVRTPTATGYGLSDCGPVICVSAEGGVEARDPATGRVRWRADGLDWARPLAGGRLLAQGRDYGRSALIDDRTGRVLQDLGSAQNVLEPEPGRLLIVGPTRSAPFGMKVSELDHRGRLAPRAFVGLVGDQGCQAAGRYLACVEPGGRLIVRDLG